MTSLIRHVDIDCADPYELAGFWQRAIGYTRHDDDRPGDAEVLLSPPDGIGPGVLFLRVPEPKASKNRLHFDLQPTDRTRDEEVERLLGLGATLVDDRRTPEGPGWVVLADPAGNEFCVERSIGERAG